MYLSKKNIKQVLASILISLPVIANASLCDTIGGHWYGFLNRQADSDVSWTVNATITKVGFNQVSIDVDVRDANCVGHENPHDINNRVHPSYGFMLSGTCCGSSLMLENGYYGVFNGPNDLNITNSGQKIYLMR